MIPCCFKNSLKARCSAIQLWASVIAIVLSSSPVLSKTSFPCDLFFEVSSAFSDGSIQVFSMWSRIIIASRLKHAQGMQCNVQFFCLNVSAACACSDASQPMFSFDAPFGFAAADDIQSGLQSGDVVHSRSCLRGCFFLTFAIADYPSQRKRQ